MLNRQQLENILYFHFAEKLFRVNGVVHLKMQMYILVDYYKRVRVADGGVTWNSVESKSFWSTLPYKFWPI